MSLKKQCKITANLIINFNRGNSTCLQVDRKYKKQTAYACGKLGACDRIKVVEASSEVLEVCVHAVVGAEAKIR